MNINSILYLLSSAIVVSFSVAWIAALTQWLLLKALSALDKGNLSRRSSKFWFTLGVWPLSLGFFLILFSVVFACLTSASYLYDHCLEHQGHPHLCFSHIAHNLPGGVFFLGDSLCGTRHDVCIWSPRLSTKTFHAETCR